MNQNIWCKLLYPFYPDCIPANLMTLLGNGLFLWLVLYYVTHLQMLMHDISKGAFWIGSMIIFTTVDGIRLGCIGVGKWIFHISNNRKNEKS